MKKNLARALVGIVLLDIALFELSRAAIDGRPYVKQDWSRPGNDQSGSLSCTAQRVDDGDDELVCTTNVLFKPKTAAEFSNEIKAGQDKADLLESQFEDCREENQRKARLIQLQTNLTDTVYRLITEDDKKALANSWNTLIEGSRQNAGINLVLWMLNNVPNMRDRFTRFNAHQSDEALKSDTAFLKQVSVIVGGLDSLISSLNNPGQLQAAFERLVEVHLRMKPSVDLQYFRPLRDNINVYISNALSVSANSAEAKAWEDLLTALIETFNSYAIYDIGLSDIDKAGLTNTWSRLTAGANGKRNAGINLVLWMLDNVPNMRDRFTKFDAHQSDEALKKDTEFLKQVDVIVGGFDLLINNVDDSVQLLEALENLADSHLNKRPVVGYDYFGPLQKVINLYIEKALGVSADSNEAKAWTHLLGAVNKVLKDHAIYDLGLSDVERQAVIRSWNRIVSGGKKSEADLVLWMLQTIPNMRGRFTKFDARQPDNVLNKDPEFVKQVNNIVNGLDILIKNLNNPIQFKAALNRLADVHLKLSPRVGLEFFYPLGQFIDDYIVKSQGVSADSNEARGWVSLIKTFNQVLKDRTFLSAVSDSDKKVLQSSWKRLVFEANGKRNAGINLVLWMFENVPNMRDRFTKFNAQQSDDALKNDAEFIKQVDRIISGVDSLINYLNDDNLFQGYIEKLVDAHLHMSPSVGLEFFKPLQRNINLYIQKALGVSADSDEPKAWTYLFATFNDFLADHTIQKIGLSASDRKILDKTWSQLTAGGKQAAGVNLVFWMLENVPDMRSQFSKFDARQSDEDLKKDPEFLKQVDNIVRGFDSLISNLNRPGQLQTALESLADYHLNRKPVIGHQFFGPLQKYIHLYIEKILGVATGSDESKAWTNLLISFNKVLKDRAIERLGLSITNRKAVVNSWKKLVSGAGGRNKAGTNLVLWMLENVPNMRSRFTKFDAQQSDEALRSDPEFQKQVEFITKGLESLVNNLDDPLNLLAALNKLADIHLAMDPRIGLEFFGPLQQNIHKYIEAAFGVDHESDETRGWTKLLGVFNNVVKQRTVLKIVSDSDRQALKSSWAKLTEGGKQNAGIDLVLWMLANVPNMRDRFTKFNAYLVDDKLRTDAEFLAQVDRIVSGLDSWISSLDNEGHFQAAIDRLVDVHLHMTPSVGLEYFTPLQENIHFYIEKALSVSADSDEAKAWTHVLTAYNIVLREQSLLKIGLSESDRRALESSWNKLIDASGGRENAGTKLVLWLFDNVPNMRDRFTKFNAHQSDEALKADPAFQKQVEVITGGLESFINNLNDPAKLQYAIEKLVEAHLNFVPSVGLEYFEAVQDYIHLYIEKTLGVSASSEEANAWTSIFVAFNKVLREQSYKKIGISYNDRKVLLSTWKRLLADASGKQNLGVRLVLWMLDNVPNMRDHFTKFNAHQSDDVLRSDPEFIKQVNRIIGGLETLINSLATPGKLQAALEKLSALHLNRVPSIGNEYFGPLKDKIHLFIEKALNVAADSEEAQAWKNLLTAFNTVLTDQAIQRIGLSYSDRKALINSWKRLTGGANGLENAGVNLVLWMFNNVPNMRARFTKFNANQPDDVLKSDPEFLKQVNAIINGLGSFVNSVNDPIELQANFDRLADFHLNLQPNVDLSYFKPLQQTIHLFIEQSLDVSSDSDESQAWTALLASFNRVVKNRGIVKIVSDSDTKALKSSWSKLTSAGKLNAGVDLVLWMLNTIPNMRNKFRKFNANQPDDVLKNDPEFLNQVQAISGGLESLVANVDKPNRLAAVLERLADAHLNMRPSIGLEFFEPLRDNFHVYIEKALGLGADSDESKAWKDLLTAFTEVFKFNSFEKIGISDSNIAALKNSWSQLTSNGKQEAGANLVLWMLDNVPQMRDRFAKFNAHQSDDALKADSEFQQQVTRIIGGLESLVNSLDEPSQLQASLERLVDVHLHMKPSVGLEYFGPLQKYIHLYIEKALGVSSSSVESRAWTSLLRAFNKVLREHSIQKIGLSDEDRRSLVNSWKRLKNRFGGKQNAGTDLVLWMLDNIPKMCDRFSKFNAFQSDAVLKNDVEFQKQVTSIIGGVEDLVDNVNNPGQFQAVLERLADVHKNKSPSIGLQYFGPLQRYIHLYIERTLNVIADSPEAKSWTRLIGAFNVVLGR